MRFALLILNFFVGSVAPEVVAQDSKLSHEWMCKTVDDHNLSIISGRSESRKDSLSAKESHIFYIQGIAFSQGMPVEFMLVESNSFASKLECNSNEAIFGRLDCSLEDGRLTVDLVSGVGALIDHVFIEDRLNVEIKTLKCQSN